MKNFVKWFGVIAFVAVIGFSMAGCATLFPPPPEFPADFTGTWIRVNLEYPHTLTITSRSIKASNQSFSWTISSIRGDSYRTTLNDGTGRTHANGTINLKLAGDYLEIIDAYDAQNVSTWAGTEDDWTGTWRRL
jgi:hypothetical protein